QGRELGHAGQRSGEQGLNLAARENGAALDQAKNVLAVAGEEFFELAGGIDLPDPQLAVGTRQALRSREAGCRRVDIQNVQKRVSGIGGNQQHRLTRIAARKMQRVSCGDGGFTYSAFADEEREHGDSVESEVSSFKSQTPLTARPFSQEPVS